MNLTQISILVACLGLLLAGVCLLYLWRLRRRLAQITPDTQALAQQLKDRPIPEALNQIFAHLEDFSRRLNRLGEETAQLHANYAATVQKIGLVRFNTDESIRGDLSFALALLDASDSGVIVTSLHSLEGCRVFLRAINQGQTQHELLPEEQLALARARGLAEHQL